MDSETNTVSSFTTSGTEIDCITKYKDDLYTKYTIDVNWSPIWIVDAREQQIGTTNFPELLSMQFQTKMKIIQAKMVGVLVGLDFESKWID